MAQPITWQNVNAPAMGNPAQFMQLATNGIDGAFDKLQGVLKQRETTDQANWNQGAVNNAEALKSALYGITTPEQMAAAQKSGQLNNMLTGFGAQVKDPAALRALMEGRIGVLQKQTTDGIAYGNTMADQKNAPIMEAYRVAGVNGDTVTQARIAAENPGMRGLGNLMEDGQKLQRDTTKFGWETQQQPLKLDQLRAQINSSNASAAASTASAEASRLTTGDAALLKNFTAKAGTAAIEHARKVDTVYKDYGVIAKSLGMPMLASGTMDRAKMTSDQVAAVDDLAQKSGLPSWKNMPDEGSGVRAFTDQAIKEGIPASVVLSSQEAVGKLFGGANLTTGTGAGRAAAKERETKATEKLRTELAANGLAGEGSTNAVRNSDEVVKYIEAVTTKDSPDREKLMQFVLEEVGKTTKVNGQEVNYPLRLVKQAINETAGKGGLMFGKGNYGFGNWRGEDTVTRMRELLQTPEYLKAIADREELEGRALAQDSPAVGGKKGDRPKSGAPLTQRQKTARNILGLD